MKNQGYAQQSISVRTVTRGGHQESGIVPDRAALPMVIPTAGIQGRGPHKFRPR